MKRLLQGFFGVLLLCALASSPARAWWWHHKKHASTADTNATKAHHEKHTREKQAREKHEPLYKFPKTVGWWHKGPGPAGAGVK